MIFSIPSCTYTQQASNVIIIHYSNLVNTITNPEVDLTVNEDIYAIYE